MGASALCGIDELTRAREWADRALALEPDDTRILYDVACVFALLKEGDRAIACLEVALKNGYGHERWIKNDPDLSSIRDHPRFPTLLESFA